MGLGNVKPLHARRKRRIARRRQRIAEAAAGVFAEQGYEAATTKDIATAADMAEGTLYNYFESKREIMLAVVETMSRPIDQLLDRLKGLEDREDMVDLFDHGLALLIDHLAFFRVLVAEVWVDDAVLQEFAAQRLHEIQTTLAAFMRENVAEGNFRPIDVDRVSRWVLAMFFGAIMPIIRGVEPPPSDEERRTLAEMEVDFILNGLRAFPRSASDLESYP